ncbi:Winged helix-turn-helix [uncultured archaeon]|nr:Winged helix-turn-helix [uncultured archaeon]
MALHNICKSRLPEVMAGKMDNVSASDLVFQNTQDGQSILKKGRSRWDIILEILKMNQEANGTKNIHVLQDGFIDWRIFDKCFNFLLNEGFIVKCNPEKNYYLTKKGRELLEGLKEINELLGNNTGIIKFLIPLLLFLNGGSIFLNWGS